MAIDFKSLGKVEQGALIAGAVSIVLSFFGRYIHVSYDGDGEFFGDLSSGSNAWTSYATLGILLVIVATAILATKALAAQALPANVPWNLVALATSGLGTFLLILRALTASESAYGVSVGPGWSGWLLFISTIALTVCAALLFKSSGESLNDFKQSNTAPPAA